ncbi:MAG: GNAT family N-acetyltransferase [Roseiflexus sp.]|nr:GNAT family N-acetyltransferase [Roseiflexus sp.]
METQTDSQHFVRGHGTVTVVTRKGRKVRIRHIQPTDAGLLVDLFHHLSPETRRFRFFTALPDLPEDILWREACRYADFDERRQAAFIALAREDGKDHAIGVVRLVLDKNDPDTAEFAIVLRDDYQREGLGTIMLDLLLQLALVRGIKRLRGISLADNEGVHRLIQKCGFPVTSHTSHGETTQIIHLE